MFNKTKGRYQKNAHHVQSMCLSESYHFLVLGFGFFQCFCGILKLNQFTHTTEIHLLQDQKQSKHQCITVHRRQLKCSSRDSKKKQLIGKMLHPDIRMYILNTVLGTNSIILTRRSCSTIKSFFVFFYHFLYSHDLNVLCSSDMVRRIQMLITSTREEDITIMLRS